ncbi:hypothetical protein I6F26_18885 [Ensifer sp. IC3342]|nr:hypothetical protein [Ensifer sp. BRP08]MCA1448647.1 hypothetical protein [Ensifer sp. IC3342]
MFAKSLFGTALVLAGLCATGAGAQEMFKKYGSEAGWDIFIRKDMGPGCLLAKINEAGQQVEMGINAKDDVHGYMALYNKADATIAAGEKLSVMFDIDGQMFEGEAIGQRIDGYEGAYARFNNPDFIYDLAKKKTLTITPNGRDPIVLSLAGTDAAFQALRACQEAQ